jgi:hypothetical protein
MERLRHKSSTNYFLAGWNWIYILYRVSWHDSMNGRRFLTILLMVSFSALTNGHSKERIFYSTFSPQDWDVYISRDEGNSFEKFTTHPSLDYDAVISPDGKWVVFTSERTGIPQLFVKSTEGNQTPELLVRSNSFQDQAAFSPDGS